MKPIFCPLTSVPIDLSPTKTGHQKTELDLTSTIDSLTIKEFSTLMGSREKTYLLAVGVEKVLDRYRIVYLDGPTLLRVIEEEDKSFSDALTLDKIQRIFFYIYNPKENCFDYMFPYSFDPDILETIGDFYEEGLGVDFDFKESTVWYKRAADQGNAQAMYKLGWNYQYGEGVEKDLTFAFEWYKKAAENGYTPAMTKLGKFYENGILDDTADYDKAFKWYQMGADRGNPESLFSLGTLYHRGLGVKNSLELAFQYYDLAANRDCEQAMNNIGYMYQHGVGTKRNTKLAKMWYTKAVQKGNEKAEKNLKTLQSRCFLF